MGNFFGDIGRAISKGVSDTAGEVKRDVNRVIGNDPPPDPRKFANAPTTTSSSSSSPQTGLPMSTTDTNSQYSNLPGGSSPLGSNSLPVSPTSSFQSSGGLPSGLSQQQANSIQSAISTSPDLQGVIDTIGGLGGDIWDVIRKVLPKNADGSVDVGKIGSDIGKFISDHKNDIIDAAKIYIQAQRGAQADQYAKQGLADVQKSYAARQPLRDAGIAGMLNPHAGTPDLSSLKTQSQSGLGIQAQAPLPVSNTAFNNAASIASGPNAANPFAKGLPLASAPAGQPSSTPSQPSQPGLPVSKLPASPAPNQPEITPPTPAQGGNKLVPGSTTTTTSGIPLQPSGVTPLPVAGHPTSPASAPPTAMQPTYAPGSPQWVQQQAVQAAQQAASKLPGYNAQAYGTPLPISGS